MNDEQRHRLEEITREGDPDQLVTKNRAAALLEVTPATITKWGREGRLPRVVLGTRTYRYRMSDIRQLIREHTERRG